MIIDDSASKALKHYLSQQLEPICDADPEVLAEYVIALLKHDKTNQDLRQLCISQLDDFLKEETEPFVANLFDALATRAYLPKKLGSPSTNSSQQILEASPNPNPHPHPVPDPTQIENKPVKGQAHPSDKNEHSSSSKPGTRKREDSEPSEDDDDRNYKHRERDGDDHRRYGDRQTGFSNRDDDRETKNKRLRGEGIPTGPASGSQYQDDRSFKRRRDESEDEFRSNKMVRSNLLGPGQNAVTTGNGYGTGNGIGFGSNRRLGYERENRLNNRNFLSIPPNPPSPIGPGRWVNDWSSNGISVPGGDRFDDRKTRGGRINDRGNGRGGPMIVGRGGFSDIRPERRQRCRDYDEKGYCMRGDLCQYDHGVDRIVVDDVPLNRPPFEMMPPIAGAPMPGSGMMGPGLPGRPPFFMGVGNVHGQYDIEPSFQTQQSSRSMTPTADAYDPERAAISRPDELIPPATNETTENDLPQNSENTPINSAISLTPSNMAHFLDPNIQQPARSSPRGRARGRGSRGGFPRTASGPGNKNSTLVVENIPTEFCTIDKVNDFFKKFGTIVNINVDLAYHKAVIQFSTSQEASKAYNSPEPIFDNRFVKVYWHKADKDDQSNVSSMPQKQIVPTTGKLELVQPPPSIEAQVSSLAEKQKEAEEKAKKQKENLKAMLDIQKQREQLIQRQIEEQKKLMELSMKKALPVKSREEIAKSLSKVSEDIKKDANVSVLKPILSGTSPGLTGTLSKAIMEEKERERLDRELDALSKLNESGTTPETALGKLSLSDASQIKFDGTSEGDSVATAANLNESSSYKMRGRGTFPFRGRARSAWPRVRGGGVSRSYKLDNRPTKLLLKEIQNGSQETLRSYFEQFGEVESLTYTEEAQSAIVQFKNRHEAEMALFKGRNIPNVGLVTMNWYNETTTIKPSESGDVNSDSNVVETQSVAPSAAATKTEPTFYEDEDEDVDERERSWKR